MGKPSGGGQSPFNLVINGTSNISSAKELWVDLGLIPNGQQYQIGKFSFTPLDSALGCEIRTNNNGKSSANLNDTTLLGKGVAKAGTSLIIDLWKNGRLYITTVLSTGVEHFWFRFYSKTNVTTEIIWNVNYLELI